MIDITRFGYSMPRELKYSGVHFCLSDKTLGHSLPGLCPYFFNGEYKMNITYTVRQIIENNKSKRDYIWDLEKYPEMFIFIESPTQDQINTALIAKLSN